MHKIIAIVNVIAWGGFWAFGYLALTTQPADSTQMVTAGLLAAAGAAVGLWAYFELVHHSEASGYAKKPNRVYQRADEKAA